MLEVLDLTVGYNGEPVLQDVSAAVERGQFVGVVGPNGSGKSTLVRAVSRVLQPKAGRVLLDGADIYRMKAHAVARRVAVVGQDHQVAFEFPVREVVMMGRAPHLSRFGLEGPRDWSVVREAMELTHTGEFAARPITSLSGGERQRCMIARALAQQPEVLILDEPTAHLDINHQIEILDLARRVTEERGLATLVVLHDLNLACQYCDRLLLLAGGRVAAEGSPREVVTEERVRAAYGADVRVRLHPATGRPYVTLISRLPVAVPPTRQTRIHLICGAGTGTDLMRRLRQLGFAVSAGVVNVTDSDQIEAEALDLPRVEEAPFSPVSEEAHGRNCELAMAADVVVVTAIPYGPGNLLNLEAAAAARDAGRRVLFVDEPAIARRDFSGGAAVRLQEQVVNAGAELSSGEEQLLAALEDLP